MNKKSLLTEEESGELFIEICKALMFLSIGIIIGYFIF